MDILVTHYEQKKTLEDSVESLSTQLSEDDTIHVVDAGSTDGSFHILEKLDYADKINLLYHDGVSRGRGRQIAFEESDAEIVVAHADLDATFYPVLNQLKDAYRRIRSKQGTGVLLVHGCFISDRSTIQSVGGWHDLQVHEDKDLWIRADANTNLYQMPVSVIQHHDNFEWDSPMYRFKRLYQNYRDAIRLGVPTSALSTSYRHHQPVSSWPVNSALLTIAARHATKMESYNIFQDGYPDPESFHLRELTFRALIESNTINPEPVSIPSEFTQYQSEHTYPGKTSYY